MSDELKVWKFYIWLTKNIAYDKYSTNNYSTDDGQSWSRAAWEHTYDGSLSTYDLKCGVCYDYANIFAIFCRYYGIPTVVISNTTHAWNLVYLGGRWAELDTTWAGEYYVDTENTALRKTYYLTDIYAYHKYDFDPTKAGEYMKYCENLDAINTYLANDKKYTR